MVLCYNSSANIALLEDVKQIILAINYDSFFNNIKYIDLHLIIHMNLVLKTKMSIFVDKPILCKLYKQLQTKPQCHSTQAINCNAFIPDKRAYAKYLLFSDSYEEVFYQEPNDLS